MTFCTLLMFIHFIELITYLLWELMKSEIETACFINYFNIFNIWLVFGICMIIFYSYVCYVIFKRNRVYLKKKKKTKDIIFLLFKIKLYFIVDVNLRSMYHFLIPTVIMASMLAGQRQKKIKFLIDLIDDLKIYQDYKSFLRKCQEKFKLFIYAEI